MSNIGICEYVIGVIHDKDIGIMSGNITRMGRNLNRIKNIRRFSPTLNVMTIWILYVMI